MKDGLHILEIFSQQSKTVVDSKKLGDVQAIIKGDTKKEEKYWSEKPRQVFLIILDDQGNFCGEVSSIFFPRKDDGDRSCVIGKVLPDGGIAMIMFDRLPVYDVSRYRSGIDILCYRSDRRKQAKKYTFAYFDSTGVCHAGNETRPIKAKLVDDVDERLSERYDKCKAFRCHRVFAFEFMQPSSVAKTELTCGFENGCPTDCEHFISRERFIDAARKSSIETIADTFASIDELQRPLVEKALSICDAELAKMKTPK